VLTGHATVLVVQNVRAAADYYRERLGFRVGLYEQDPDDYATAEREGCHVHLARLREGPVHPNHHAVPPDLFDAYFWVDNVDAIHAELKERGATIIQGPVDQEYGLREIRVQDLDGHILAFGRRIAA
jgi:catechol 2,3-dioxygenase-like lactoylglutathione lyase family enzyme